MHIVSSLTRLCRSLDKAGGMPVGASVCKSLFTV